MKLTANNIKFIDNYLENSGVEYFDIRVEMADHVASALEDMDGDFYDNFRRYMARHKTALLASYKKFKKAVARKMIMQLFKNAVKPGGLLLLGVMLSFVAMLVSFKGEAVTFEILEVMYLGLEIIVTIHFYYTFLSSKKKFSATYTLIYGGWITLIWVLGFIRLDRIFESVIPYVSIIYYTIILYMLAIFYGMYITIRKELIQRYNIINA